MKNINLKGDICPLTTNKYFLLVATCTSDVKTKMTIKPEIGLQNPLKNPNTGEPRDFLLNL